MADEGAVAVAEAPAAEAVETFAETPAAETPELKPEGDKTDGRRQPDALRKRIAEIKRQADAVVDPAEKASLLADAQALTNSVGKVGAYEKVFPLVRDAREAKDLIDTFGGREGLAGAQATLQQVQQIDKWLDAGDKQASDAMWKESPQGMAKLAPVIFSELEKNNPQEYAKAVVPHAVKFFDNAGFPAAFDRMVTLFAGGRDEDGNTISPDPQSAKALAKEIAQWFRQQRGGSQQQDQHQVDPRVAEAERERDEIKAKEQERENKANWAEMKSHGDSVLDKHLRSIVGKIGLSQEQFVALRNDAWNHLITKRENDQTYQTVAKGKHIQGIDAVKTFAKSYTEDNALDAARNRANFWYGHQLKNGAVKTPNVTAAPITPGITKGKEPNPSEIDYSAKGIAVAKKQGFKDLGDMILAGKAPLKAGGIRQWR